jgi:putative addiction module component (TIGR02574 family)
MEFHDDKLKFVGQKAQIDNDDGTDLGAADYIQHSLDKVELTCHYSAMSKTEILEELPNLTKQERDEIRRKLTEIDGESWFADNEVLTCEEKAPLDARLAAYLEDPDVGSSWEEVESRILSLI